MMGGIVLRIDVLLSREKILEAIVELNATGRPYTITQIAERVGCHRTTVIRALDDLEVSNQVRRERGVGRGQSNRYRIVGDD